MRICSRAALTASLIAVTMASSPLSAAPPLAHRPDAVTVYYRIACTLGPSQFPTSPPIDFKNVGQNTIPAGKTIEYSAGHSLQHYTLPAALASGATLHLPASGLDPLPPGVKCEAKID